MSLCMSLPKKIVMILCLSGLAACSNVPRLITEYRIDVQQGNVLTQEMVGQLRPGLSKDQVRYVLGTPVLTDIFHGQRWDYVYRLQRGIESKPVLRRFSVYFDGQGLLERVDGDLELATASDLEVVPNRVKVIDLSSLPEGVETSKSSVSDGQKGWWGRLTETLGF